eukprot:4684523-Amphidinium_carterae.1
MGGCCDLVRQLAMLVCVTPCACHQGAGCSRSRLWPSGTCLMSTEESVEQPSTPWDGPSAHGRVLFLRFAVQEAVYSRLSRLIRHRLMCAEGYRLGVCQGVSSLVWRHVACRSSGFTEMVTATLLAATRP